MMSKKIALIIDCNAFLYRSYFATQHQTHNSFAALQTTIWMIKKVLQHKKYDYALLAYDVGKKTFRTEIFPDYKGTRPPMPEILKQQFDLLLKFSELIGLKAIGIPNFEADDVIASFNELCIKSNVFVEIFSTDKDLLQLISSKTSIHFLKKGTSEYETYNFFNFSKKLNGLVPNQIIDWKAMAGDQSDNYKGITGIGKKGSLDLLLNFQTIENIFNNLAELSEKKRNIFLNNKEQLTKFIKLATLVKDLKIEQNLNDYLLKTTNEEEVKNFYRMYSLK